VTGHVLLFKLLGTGETTLPWSAELPAILPCATTNDLDMDGVDAVLVAGSLGEDEFEVARQALLAGLPVLVAKPAQLAARQIIGLSRAARRGSGLLRFAQVWSWQRKAGDLQRLRAGAESLLQTRSIDILRLADRHSIGSLACCLREELAWIASFRHDHPIGVRATTNETAREACSSALVSLLYGDGTALRCTAALTEGIDSRQVHAGGSDRKLVLSAGPVASSDGNDRYELVRFCEGVRTHDGSLGNHALWSHIAALWADVEHSLSMDQPLGARNERSQNTNPPPLRLIEGGGRSGRHGPRPRLTLVAS
jgi:hypothetical protein